MGKSTEVVGLLYQCSVKIRYPSFIEFLLHSETSIALFYCELWKNLKKKYKNESEIHFGNKLQNNFLNPNDEKFRNKNFVTIYTFVFIQMYLYKCIYTFVTIHLYM